jgi:hypothetical protein
MDVFALQQKIVSDYRHYIESFVRINDERIDHFVQEQFEQGALWPDAILQLNPAYEFGPTLGELAARDIILKATADFFRGPDRKPAAVPAPTTGYRDRPALGVVRRHHRHRVR